MRRRLDHLFHAAGVDDDLKAGEDAISFEPANRVVSTALAWL